MKRLSQSRFLCLIFVSCLPSCSGAPSERSATPSVGQKTPVATAIKTPGECRSAGGEWAGDEIGRGRLIGCLMPTADANTICLDSSECESACLYDPALDARDGKRGRCWRLNQYKGCGILVGRGNEQRVQCVD